MLGEPCMCVLPASSLVHLTLNTQFGRRVITLRKPCVYVSPASGLFYLQFNTQFGRRVIMLGKPCAYHLHLAHADAEVGLVELVGNVPSDWSKLAALLDGGVKEGDVIEERLPLRQVADVQLVLSNQMKRCTNVGLNITLHVPEDIAL